MPSAATPSPDGLDEGIRLTVAGVAARLGVAAPTLRTWARRYGLGPSGHVAGSHRRYDATDLARLETMRRLTLQGVAPADAADIALRAPGAGRPANGNAPGADGASTAAAGTATGPATSSNGRTEDVAPLAGEGADDEPMVADPLTVAAAAVDGDHHRLARLIRRAGREHGLLDGWLMTVRPAMEMVAQRPQPDRPGHDPELLLQAQMMGVLAESTVGREPGEARALVHTVAATRTDAHVLAAELILRGVQVRVAHERQEADQGQPLLEFAQRQEQVLTVVLGESEVAEHLVRALCERGLQVFLIALTDSIAPRPGLHRARTLSGALHEIMSLLT